MTLFYLSPSVAPPLLFLFHIISLPPFSRHFSGLSRELVSLLLSLQDSRMYVAYDVRRTGSHHLELSQSQQLLSYCELQRKEWNTLCTEKIADYCTLRIASSVAAADRQRHSSTLVKCAKPREGRRKPTRQEILLNKGYGLEYHSTVVVVRRNLQPSPKKKQQQQQKERKINGWWNKKNGTVAYNFLFSYTIYLYGTMELNRSKRSENPVDNG